MGAGGSTGGAMEPDGWSELLSPACSELFRKGKQAASLSVAPVLKATIEGSSRGRPVYADRECTGSGIHEWEVTVNGNSGAATIGVANFGAELKPKDGKRKGKQRRRSSTTTTFENNSQCHGFRLNGRSIFSAGKTVKREEGPEKFPVPCTVNVQMDIKLGTLSAKVSYRDSNYKARRVMREHDLGVLCSEVPSQGKMHLAACTFGPANSNQQITIEWYKPPAVPELDLPEDVQQVDEPVELEKTTIEKAEQVLAQIENSEELVLEPEVTEQVLAQIENRVEVVTELLASTPSGTEENRMKRAASIQELRRASRVDVVKSLEPSLGAT